MGPVICVRCEVARIAREVLGARSVLACPEPGAGPALVAVESIARAVCADRAVANRVESEELVCKTSTAKIQLIDGSVVCYTESGTGTCTTLVFVVSCEYWNDRMISRREEGLVCCREDIAI